MTNPPDYHLKAREIIAKCVGERAASGHTAWVSTIADALAESHAAPPDAQQKVAAIIDKWVDITLSDLTVYQTLIARDEYGNGTLEQRLSATAKVITLDWVRQRMYHILFGKAADEIIAYLHNGKEPVIPASKPAADYVGMIRTDKDGRRCKITGVSLSLDLTTGVVWSWRPILPDGLGPLEHGARWWP